VWATGLEWSAVDSRFAGYFAYTRPSALLAGRGSNAHPR
jgi:hypothetical protein